MHVKAFGASEAGWGGQEGGGGREKDCCAVLCCAEGRAVAQSEGQSRKEDVSEDECLCLTPDRTFHVCATTCGHVHHASVLCADVCVIMFDVSQCVC